ncbi:ribonuclease III [Yamadazyma tenuis]|uniref:ribonuclease III n=1 Tax=Candida tenuis (strain ATCC 10573 / BCRC 21748 / CBS 615 / JCM 9827 / NBRC 10315 / NRRL Y-1498 / VKM Y-70) TaxID=590646 RepID=G3B622_CANTC|nr:uncharacterized protein CANTEDRAFT_94123 [Yamadazyma tenuis ATCC 10573]EGV63359.1 hypothetical protein CANTEDRAFT_94123 [Yamadazyma tenuis ATCC 10573]WEJ96816.1 ribonuclease III [Yamadazyma tenuis]
MNKDVYNPINDSFRTFDASHTPSENESLVDQKRHMTDSAKDEGLPYPKRSGSVNSNSNVDLSNSSGEGLTGDGSGRPSFGFVDIKKLEHSARMLQKNIKLIVDEAPNIEYLNQLIKSQRGSLDSLTYDSLRTNKLVHLAAQVKSLYEEGRLKIFDGILENDLNKSDLSEIETPNESPQDRSTAPIIPSSDSENETYVSSVPDIIRNKDEEQFAVGSTDDCPELPLIKDPHLYARVFIHKSTINNKSYLYQSELITSHNERLEFLGDSVLNNLATLIIYERYPTAPEGELSKMRSILVNNVTLAEFSIKYGFDKKLKSNINDTILRQGKQKIFADIFEAYVGALSMEDNLESGVLKSWLFKLYWSRLKVFDEEIRETEEVNKDAKSELYSLVGTAAFHPTYDVITTGDGASKPFKVSCVMGDEVLGTAVAPGLKEAGLRAAMVALKNKPMLEKYIQLRLNTDKTQSIVSHKQGSPMELETTTLVDPDIQLPLKAEKDMEFDSDARNKLYAIVSKKFNLVPEYYCEETEDRLFTAELRIDNKAIAFATDISKKKAMAKAAKLALDTPAVFWNLHS